MITSFSLLKAPSSQGLAAPQVTVASDQGLAVQAIAPEDRQHLCDNLTNLQEEIGRDYVNMSLEETQKELEETQKELDKTQKELEERQKELEKTQKELEKTQEKTAKKTQEETTKKLANISNLKDTLLRLETQQVILNAKLMLEELENMEKTDETTAKFRYLISSIKLQQQRHKVEIAFKQVISIDNFLSKQRIKLDQTKLALNVLAKGPSEACQAMRKEIQDIQTETDVLRTRKATLQEKHDREIQKFREQDEEKARAEHDYNEAVKQAKYDESVKKKTTTQTQSLKTTCCDKGKKMTQSSDKLTKVMQFLFTIAFPIAFFSTLPFLYFVFI